MKLYLISFQFILLKTFLKIQYHPLEVNIKDNKFCEKNMCLALVVKYFFLTPS